MLLLLQELQSIIGGGHVGHFDVVLDAGSGDLLGRLQMNVVLHGGGHDDIHLVGAQTPGLLAGEEGHTELVGVILHLVAAGSTHLQHVVDLLVGDHAVLVIDVTVGTGHGNDLAAQLGNLLHDTPGHVAEAGDGHALALDGVVLVLEDLVQVVDSTETGSLGTDQRTTEGHALTGDHAVLEGADDAAVLAVQIADLAGTHAHVAGGHVNVGANVTIQFGHKGLAETHDLSVGLAGGIEVGTALGTADGQGGQSILKGLLKAKEFDHGQSHVGLEAQTALVGADGAVVLHAVAAVDLPLAVVVHPGHTELDHALRLDHALQQSNLLILGMGLDDGGQRGQDLFHSLQELGLVGVLGLGGFQNSIKILAHD